jgi:PAS domain S-box-containing protein
MPESMSFERRKLLKAFGAKLVLTPAKEGMDGAIAKAKELESSLDNAIVLQQFQNMANPQIHSITTAKEILDDTEGRVDVFVASVGTGGTLSGTAQGLKKELKEIAVFAVEPKNSAVLSGGSASVHGIQGIGAGFIPDILDTDIYSEVIKVSNEDAINTAKMLAKEEAAKEEVAKEEAAAVLECTLHDLAARIRTKKEAGRPLVVVNSSGRYVGIITETDMIKGLRTSYTDHLKDVIHQQARQLKEVRQQMEEAAILDSMLQSAGEIAISIMDPELNILLHNQAAAKFYDSTSEKLTGKNAAILHKSAGNLDQFIRALAAARKDGRYEFILKQKGNGSTRYLATTLFCIYDNKKNNTGFGLIALDITRQKQHELSLQAERDFSSKIIDAAPSIICSITPDGAIQFINPAGEQLTGYKAEELLKE